MDTVSLCNEFCRFYAEKAVPQGTEIELRPSSSGNFFQCLSQNDICIIIALEISTIVVKRKGKCMKCSLSSKSSMSFSSANTKRDGRERAREKKNSQ